MTKRDEPRPIETIGREEALSVPRKPFRERLLTVIEGASYVQKKGRNREQNYNYAMEADFLELVKPLLMEAGIIPIPLYAVIGNEQVQTQTGKPANLVTVELSLTLQDAFSDEKVMVQSIGQGRDPQDKACYKAMTGAMKYALAKSFLIPTGDDPEEEEEKENPARREEKGKVKDEPTQAKKVDLEAFKTAVEKERDRIGSTQWVSFLNAHELTYPNQVLGLSDDEKRAFYKALIAVKA